METVGFKTIGLETLKLDIHRTTERCLGCIIFIHGGALLLGSRSDLPKNVIDFLNSNCWDVASLDYRLAPENSIEQILEDVSDGCCYLRELFPSSPLLLVGHSAGAYLALQYGVKGTAVDGICAFAGYGDLSARWYYEPCSFFQTYTNVDYIKEKIELHRPFLTHDERVDLYIYLRQKGLWPEFVLGKSSVEQLAHKYSPISHIANSYPRTVLIHGELDSDVPSDTSVKMAKALKDKNIPHKLLLLPNLNHDLFLQLENPKVLAAWLEALRFLCPWT